MGEGCLKEGDQLLARGARRHLAHGAISGQGASALTHLEDPVQGRIRASDVRAYVHEAAHGKDATCLRCGSQPHRRRQLLQQLHGLRQPASQCSAPHLCRRPSTVVTFAASRASTMAFKNLPTQFLGSAKRSAQV
jgi:hypothetical protein